MTLLLLHKWKKATQTAPKKSTSNGKKVGRLQFVHDVTTELLDGECLLQSCAILLSTQCGDTTSCIRLLSLNLKENVQNVR
jgi:hypothetical protein